MTSVVTCSTPVRRAMVWATACVAVWLSPAAADESLLSLVRQDVGVCVRCDRIADWPTEIPQTVLWERVTSLEVVREWTAGPDFARLQGTVKLLSDRLGRPLIPALSDLAGEETVLAVYAVPGHEPEAILLCRPRSEENARRVLNWWNELDRAEVLELPEGYVRRTGAGKTLYYRLDAGLFAFSESESLVREVAELRSGGRDFGGASLQHSAAWLRAEESLQAPARATVFVQPAEWRTMLLRAVRGDWPVILQDGVRAAESVILGVDPRHGVHLELNVLFAGGNLPGGLSNYRQRSGEETGLWRESFGERTLLSISGRGGGGLLGNLFELQVHRREARDARVLREVLRGLFLGRDPVDEVAVELSREWGVRMTVADSETDVPVELQLSLRTAAAGDTSDGAPAENGSSLPAALNNAVLTAFRVAETATADTQPLVLQQKVLAGGTMVRWLEGHPVWRPAAVVTPGGLELGSAPEVVERSLAARPDAAVARVPDVAARVAGAQGVAYVNLQVLAELLETRGDDVLEMLGVPAGQREKALREARRAAGILNVFDEGYAGLEVGDGLLRVRFGGQVLSDSGDRTE